MSDARIIIQRHAQGAAVRPADFLGDEVFAAYRDACGAAGATYDADAKRSVCPVPQLPRLIENLERIGLRPVVAPDIATELAAHAEQIRHDMATASTHVAAIEAELATRGLTLFQHQREGIAWLAPRRRAGLWDAMGLGKQQPVDTKVLTPRGWRPIGAIRVGDKVIGSDGRPCSVTGVFPQGVRESYRVTFSDHSSVEAGPEHLWAIDYRCGGKRWRRLILTTRQLLERPIIELPHARTRTPSRLDLSKTALYLPILSRPAEFTRAELPIPPYTAGMLLANGSCTGTSPVVTTHLDDVDEVRAALSAEGMALGHTKNYEGRSARFILTGVASTVHEHFGVLSRYKRIPEVYLRAAPEDRVALLQGLMDGDGSISAERNKVSFSSTSADLAKGVQELVECLGGIASTRTYDRSRENKPIEYVVRIRLPEGILPFRTMRKGSRYRPGNRARPRRTVAACEYVRDVESVCISVDAEDALYVTEHAILTHNTIQALLAAPRGAPTAIVCPASVKLNWRDETLRWRPDARVRVLQGRAKWEWPMPGEIVIGNYEVLPELDRVGRRKSIPERYGAPAAQTCVIADEIHYAKSSVAKRSQSLRAVMLAALAADGRAWGLSGTPLVNRPQELWNVLKCLQLAEEAFGTWKEFRVLLGGYQGRWGTKWDGEIDASVPKRLQRVSLYRRREDVLDLPPKMRVSVEVPGKFPPDVRKLLDEVLDALAEQGVNLDEAAELIDLTKVSGAAFEQLSKARAALATAKIPSMLELVEACEEEGEPVIVFSAHRAPIDVLAQRRGWATITGSQKVEARQEAVRAFQAGELRGIGCTIKAGGIGITLTRAAHEIFVDLAWTPADNNQAEDRACRIGQTRSVLVRRLVADHELDRRIEQVLRAKQEIIDATVEPSAVRRVQQNHTADLEANADRLERAIGGRPSPPPAERPAGAETWVRHAILELHAQNAFSDTDRPLASTLVAPCIAGQPLAPALWKVALTILPKYTAIVGAMPHAV